MHACMLIRFIAISEPHCIMGTQRGHSSTAVYVVMHDVHTHALYLCVGSTAPCLDISLFAINLMF